MTSPTPRPLWQRRPLEASDLVQGYSFWTFSDIFEENYFPSVPFHGGFGLLTLHGVAKPTYRAFELLHKLGSERLLVDGLHETVNAWVTRDHARVSVLLVNHALPRHSIATSARARSPCACAGTRWCLVRANRRASRKRQASMAGVGRSRNISTARPSNSFMRLRAMAREACPWTWRDGRLALEIELPPHAVAALTVEFAPA